MGISIGIADESDLQARIKVVGVGGGGGNALNTMINSGLDGVDFIAANTDIQALAQNLAPTKLQLGPGLTRGLGAGGNPEVGRKSALEDVQRVADALQGADMVFVTAGMGGGTGTGAAPVISQIARDQGALTVAVVTKPFMFEGRKRGRFAQDGIEELVDSVDTIITIPNEKLLQFADDDRSLLDTFRRADDVLVQAVRSISDLILQEGMINVDFADVKTIMNSTGRALMGSGVGRGERRALDAAEMAINSPLLEDVSVDGATGILINFTTGLDVSLKEINEAAGLIHQVAHEDAHIIFGMVTEPELTDLVKVTVIATGFDMEQTQTQPVSAFHHGSQAGQRGLQQRSIQQHVATQHAANQHVGHARGARSQAARRPTSPGPSRAPGRTATGLQPTYAGASPHEVHAQPPAHPKHAPTRPQRAFGATALHDEAVLDIPAYLRRSSGNESSGW